MKMAGSDRPPQENSSDGVGKDKDAEDAEHNEFCRCFSEKVKTHLQYILQGKLISARSFVNLPVNILNHLHLHSFPKISKKSYIYLKSQERMEEHESLYEKISEILGGSPGNLKVLEQQIDLDLQMEYYECSRKIREEKDEAWALEHIQILEEPGYSVDVKKEILARMASMANTECYRAIESFLGSAKEPLRTWAVLSLNESRMVLESKIMDENQVFISTGLGGKDEKLRYFVVLMTRSRVDLSDTQQMIIRNEFEYVLKKFDAELEESHFSGSLATILILLPMKYPLKSVFSEAIAECNRYGDFLNDDFIVTNVRVLSFEEIEEFLEKRNEIN
jgi:hypothetical protein